MYEYVRMNIDIRNIDCCMNIDVRVPSLIAGSLPAIMIWHKSTIVDCGCFYFWSTTAKELALHELATNQTQQEPVQVHIEIMIWL